MRLVMLWPARIREGQRFDEPVSMLDILPTVLDLTGLPMPNVMQGQSLAPLLLGQEGGEPRPVILDEFRVDPEPDELRGTIEVIDGCWAASSFIDPRPDQERIFFRGHAHPNQFTDALWNRCWASRCRCQSPVPGPDDLLVRDLRRVQHRGHVLPDDPAVAVLAALQRHRRARGDALVANILREPV